MRITLKQKNILITLAKGETLAIAAKKLNITYNNMRKQTQNLYKKFDVHNRKELILKAVELKIISTKNISGLFKKRYQHQSSTNIVPAEILNNREIEYLKLAAQGFTKEEIIKKLNILNMNFCNYIIGEICKKLNTKNITHSVYIAAYYKLI